MVGYDPFSEGSRFEKKTTAKGKNNKMLIKGIIIFMVLVAVGLLVYFLVFNTVTISFNIKNTEGQKMTTDIEIIKEGNSSSKKIIGSDESIKLKKNSKYSYTVVKTGYSTNKTAKVSLDTSKDNEVKVVLEKDDVKLIITGFNCGQKKVYLGQTVICQIDTENKSPSSSYDVSYFVFSGLDSDDFKNKNYSFINKIEGTTLLEEKKTILPQTKNTFYLKFKMPNDKKFIGKKTLNIRILHRNMEEYFDFEIADSPNISFSSDVSKLSKLTSGQEGRITYTVDNSKNATEITDLILSVDANYTTESDFELNLQQAITKDATNIEVNSKAKKTGIININLPLNARAGKIEGKIILSGSVLPETLELPFTINVEEPENKFTVKLSKATETIKYNLETGKSSERTLTLQVNNDNPLKVNIEEIKVVDLLEDGCENWIKLTNVYDNFDLEPKNNLSIPIIIKGDDIIDVYYDPGTKLCAISFNYKNPFTGRNVNNMLNLTITVE